MRLYVLAAILAWLVPQICMAQPNPVTLEKIRVSCTMAPCSLSDAVVFVHGINGSAETFQNGNFDWPLGFPLTIGNRPIDVYRLDYRSSLLSWAQGRNPLFDDVVDKVVEKLSEIRTKEYRSIGFIAHSLGGNIVASYLQTVKAEYGHAQRAQHAFLITLGTPRSGTNIADIAGVLRDVLLIKNDLLESLKDNNIYLRMLRLLGEKTDGKSIRFGCRPVLLYVGYELEGVVGPITVVSERNAVGEATARVARDVKGFQVNHFEIAKPAGLTDPIHLFVQDSIEDAYTMVAGWPAGVDKLCSDAKFVDERSGPDLNSYPAKNYIRPKRLSN